MISSKVRALCVAAFAAFVLLPSLTLKIAAPANYGAHDLTTGFGRGRLDLPGIVSEGTGGRLNLPGEALRLDLRLSGNGPIRLSASGAERTMVASEIPGSIQLDLPQGGSVTFESASRIRLHEVLIERPSRPWREVGALALLGLIAVLLSMRSWSLTLAALVVCAAAFGALTHGHLSGAFAGILFARLAPLLAVTILCLPLVVGIAQARFLRRHEASRLALGGFAASLLLFAFQLRAFDQPLPMGDPAAYFEMAGKFADAAARLDSPLGLGAVLTDLRPYLALPATGVLYGFLRWIGGGLALVYAIQAIAMAFAVFSLVSIAESQMGPRAAKLALLFTLLHPTFSIAPGIVQPEPFILAVWTSAALITLLSLQKTSEEARRSLLGAGILLGVGLALHPQGLSFLLLALALSLLPWGAPLARHPRFVLIPMLGVFTVLLPVAAAERFSKPLAYVLDKQYGFFAYTSSHPLGFWLYTDSDGWQGPLRIDGVTYQKELVALKGESATSSSFADVASFVSRHPRRSLQTVLTNLHRLWNQPDNPFAVSFPLPYGVQVAFHRALVVFFLMSLPALLSSRLAILALPFVMLSMTYPAYHVFNKYATPALPFMVIGAAFAVDRLSRERSKRWAMWGGLALAALGALLPAAWFAHAGISGAAFLAIVRSASWAGVGIASFDAIRAWGGDSRSRGLATVVVMVLLVSSVAASRTDTVRTVWASNLDRPFEVSCQVAAAPPVDSGSPRDPAWLLVDVESSDAKPPTVEVNGARLGPVTPTMPAFGLATFRGHREPAAFRQIWRAPIGEGILSSGTLAIRVSGDPSSRVFGDLRTGRDGPRLSLGNWPHLSVYRLMHEGQYRLPTFDVPPQACFSSGWAGRPGIALARIPAGEETQMSVQAGKPLEWIF